MNKTDIPARHDGPITYSSNIMTVATCRGLIHKKCKYKVTFWKKDDCCQGTDGWICRWKHPNMSRDYLIEPVDVVGQEVYDLSRGRLGKRSAVQTKSLCRNRDGEHKHPTRGRKAAIGGTLPSALTFR